MDISKVIRVLLAEKNKNQTWLADEIGTSKTYISQLCSGERKPSLDMVIRISMAFEIKASELIARAENDITSI